MSWKKYFFAISAPILILAAAALAGCKRKPAPVKMVTDEGQVAYYYALTTERLFNIQLNGALRLTYTLDIMPQLRAAGFECVLTHELETMPDGTTRSAWILPFTQSCLVPHNQADLLWRLPTGRTLLFKNARTTDAPVTKGEAGWKLRKIGLSEYNIYNDSGYVFYYINGSLDVITTPRLRRYRVATRGGLITGVSDEFGRTLFSAQFDDFGHCTQVQFIGRAANKFDWDAQGFLRSWRSSSGSRLGFQYKDGLLARVIEPGKADFPIIWAENAKFVCHDADYGAPVYVKSAGVRSYSLSYSSHGICIVIKCPDEKQDSTTIYGPQTRILVQKFGRQTWRFDLAGEQENFRYGRVEIIISACPDWWSFWK